MAKHSNPARFRRETELFDPFLNFPVRGHDEAYTTSP